MKKMIIFVGGACQNKCHVKSSCLILCTKALYFISRYSKSAQNLVVREVKCHAHFMHAANTFAVCGGGLHFIRTRAFADA